MKTNKALLLTLALTAGCVAQSAYGMNNPNPSNNKTIETIQKPECGICYESLKSGTNISCLNNKPHTYHQSCVNEFFRENQQATQQCFVCSKEFNGPIKTEISLVEHVTETVAEGLQVISYSAIEASIPGLIIGLATKALGVSSIQYVASSKNGTTHFDTANFSYLLPLSAGACLLGGLLYLNLELLYKYTDLSPEKKEQLKQRAMHNSRMLSVVFAFLIFASLKCNV